MSNEKRKDTRGRTLKNGESQRSDGRYQYQYTGLDKKRHVVYSWRLLPSDGSHNGKKGDKSLREKESELPLFGFSILQHFLQHLSIKLWEDMKRYVK